MEQTNESLFALEFDQQAASYITESAKWSKFLAIVWFVLCGLFIIFAIFAGSLIANLYSGMSYGVSGVGAGMGGLVTALYLIFAAIQVIPNIFRYQFATKAIRAIRNNDQALLNESLGKLKTYNKYWGIVTIIIISIYVLIFLFAILGAAMR
jgi:low affinity Fe/Cu permease